ncbi:MAG: hydroxyethylthiazole kinase [Roseburia sp.]|nr:hydroxyethylthiazole kinase [Roseburia sp.]
MKRDTELLERAGELLESVRSERPLVHCITNAVTVNDCANILLAAGARPTMAHHPLEAAEITAGCDALVCNFGATEDYEAMFLAAKEAGSLGHPIIVDPVGAGGSTFRREKIREFFSQVPVSLIRGNASEMLSVFHNAKTAVGVDARKTDGEDIPGLAKGAFEFAGENKCICVISGERDIIADGKEVFYVENGSPWMSGITGSGCMSTALLGAFLSMEVSVASAAAVPFVMGIAGEIAEKRCSRERKGTMSFKAYMIDEVSLLKREEIIKYGKGEVCR